MSSSRNSLQRAALSSRAGLGVRLGAGAAVLLSQACWVPAETGEKMQADILALQQQMQTANKGLDEQRAQLAEQMQRADAKIGEVSEALADLNRAARMTDADFGVQLERLISEVQELRGAIELTEYRLGQLQGRLDAAPPPAVASAAPPAVDDASQPPPAPAAAAPVPKDKKGMLAHANKLASEGKRGDARGIYREVIKQWPSELGTTDEAHYRIGETYFDEKKYRDALPELIKVIEKFSKGDFVDDAYYKIGLASMELGNLEDAQIFFNEVIKNYKRSPLAKSAEAKLGEVKKRLERESKGKAAKKK